MAQTFKQSNQFLNWTFTAEKLNQLRQASFAPMKNELSHDQARKVVLFHDFWLQRIADTVLHVPPKVAATGSIFFKRLYLYRNFFEIHPKVAMVICLYIACKVEEHHNSADELSRKLALDVKPEQILNGEKFVLQTLQFHLTILHPFRSIEAYFTTIDLKDQDLENKMKEKAIHLLMLTLVTDVWMIYTPAQIALATTLTVANGDSRVVEFVSTITSKSPQLEEIVNKIQPFLAKLRIAPPPEADVIALEQKFAPLSQLFQNAPETE